MKLRSVLAPYWRETISTRVRSIKVKTIGICIPIVIVHIVGTAHAQEFGPRLWITDDTTRTVYEVTLDGELISSFPDNAPNDLKKANSGITLDPSDDTLWGASEQTQALRRGSVVNFTKDGKVVLSQIPATDFDACAVEGVTFDYFDASLWAVDDPINDVDCPAPQNPTVHHISKDSTETELRSTLSK